MIDTEIIELDSRIRELRELRDTKARAHLASRLETLRTQLGREDVILEDEEEGSTSRRLRIPFLNGAFPDQPVEVYMSTYDVFVGDDCCSVSGPGNSGSYSKRDLREGLEALVKYNQKEVARRRAKVTETETLLAAYEALLADVASKVPALPPEEEEDA